MRQYLIVHKSKKVSFIKNPHTVRVVGTFLQNYAQLNLLINVQNVQVIRTYSCIILPRMCSA